MPERVHRSALAARLTRGDAAIFREMFQLLGEAVTVRDPSGALVYANQAALKHLGFASIDELQRSSSQAIMDDYLVEDEHGQPLTHDDIPSVRLLRGERVEPTLMRTVNLTTGEVRWDLLKTSVLQARRGRIRGVLTVIDDVTDVKTAELRTRILAESGRILASSLDYRETLRNIVALAVPSLVDYCAVDLLDGSGDIERVAARHRDQASAALAEQLRSLPTTKLDRQRPIGQVIESGTSQLFQNLTDATLTELARDQDHLSRLRELDPRSIVLVPLSVPRRTIGVMTLGTDRSGRRLDDADVALAEQLGRRAAVAVENARLHTKLSEVAETLQKALLPRALPAIPGWELASLYRPAETELRIDVGGDFYEFFENEGVWLALIGDVTGKGVAAASVTSLMRHGARVAARSEPAPASILSRLDEALAEESGRALCTALCLRLADDHVVISSAGHPPAIIVAEDGSLRQVPEAGPVLGAFDDANWPEETVSIQPGELLVMYTDGVIETVGERERFGTERLRALLSSQAGEDPKTVLERLEAALAEFASGSGSDDVAALALRR